MKKIIKKRVYNTETAKLLGEWCSQHEGSDFAYYEESLYRTKSGAYFIYGSGNAASKYSRQTGNNNWSGGRDIIPITPEAAREWAEKRLDADDYIEIFGEPEEASDDSKVSLSLYISAESRRRLEILRDETGSTISKIVDDLIAEKL